MSNLVKHTIKNRQKINRLILEELTKLVEKYPTMRFGQLLNSHVIIESRELLYPFELMSAISNEESANVLARILKSEKLIEDSKK